MRLFIGIKTGCEAYLRSLQQKLQERGKGSFVEAENLHLTLRFLGEIPPSGLPNLYRAMSEVREGPIFLECRGARMFNKNGIASAEVGGDTDRLSKLYCELEAALEKVGFPKEPRDFRAHITLARNFRTMGDFEIESMPFSACSFIAEEIVLFESRRDFGKLVYVPLFTYKLKE